MSRIIDGVLVVFQGDPQVTAKRCVELFDCLAGQIHPDAIDDEPTEGRQGDE